jgi:hypothetical protein
VSVVPLLALLVALGSCASATRQDNPFTASTAAGQIHVKVRNDNFYDATIWAVVNGARQRRLGIVSGKHDADFTMAWTLPQPLQFDIDLLTGDMACRTRSMIVDPGDDLELQITADFGQIRGCS